VEGRIILKCILKDMGYQGVDCFYLGQDAGQWEGGEAVLNTVINLLDP
jgi:hypothetical protein